MKRILLIRHCETRQTGERYIGKTDAPLSPRGVIHARKLEERLKGATCSRILSSPSQRALDTARLATQRIGLAIEEDADLSEIDFGRWERLSFQEISEKDPDLVKEWNLGRDDFCFPEGESLSAFRERVCRVGGRISLLPEENIIAVTHGGVIRFLLCHFLGLPFQSNLIFDIRPGSITRIHLSEGAAVLAGLNDCCHMEGF